MNSSFKLLCLGEGNRFFKSFWGFLFILPRGLIGLLKIIQQNMSLDPPPPQSNFRPNFGVIGQRFWLKCSPINPIKFQENANTGDKNAITETEAHMGQNWPKSAMRVMRILRAERFFQH